MNIKIRYKDDIVVVDVQGNLDFGSAPLLKIKLETLIELGYHKIIVDLSKANFIDSTGVGTLMHGLKKIDSTKGDLKIVGLSPQNANIFSVLELDKVFSILPNEIQALRSFFSDGSTIH